VTYFYHSVVDSPHLPRDLGHDSTQNMVVTLLGEFWRYSPSLTIPSAALVDLMASVDVSPAGARAALSRLLRKGTVEISRSGRTTAYSLTPAVAATIPTSEILTWTFGESEREWNGEWTVIVFSIPETRRDLRQTLRDWLRWLGYGPARDGVWISPHSDLELTKSTLTGLLPPDGLIFRSAHMTGTIDPAEVWPLAELRDQYKEFIAELRPVVYRLRAGMVSPAEALKLSVSLLGRWRGFPTVDPDLPREYLPADWPRREARRLFVEVHDACVAPATEHVRNVVAQYDPAAAAAVQGLTVAEAIELYRTPAGGTASDVRVSASA
jgi:phenylacetic acid degradation operon negative regulatory protein